MDTTQPITNDTTTMTTTTTTTTALPRFSLKKRTFSISEHAKKVNLKTVTSALLSGLFADVAATTTITMKPPFTSKDGNNNNNNNIYQHRQTTTSSAPTATTTLVSCVDDDPRLDVSKPNKKSRTSITRSMSRCGRSFKILDEALAATADLLQDDTTTATTTAPVSSTSSTMTSSSFSFDRQCRQDSLLYQLDCVSRGASAAGNDATTTTTASSATAIFADSKILFPQLPATISTSSCSTKNSNSTALTRSVSDLQKSITENNNNKDKDNTMYYGWFVEMDDDDDHHHHHYATSLCHSPMGRNGCNNNGNNSGSYTTVSLAFSAPTAPKAVNYDAEVEWARAADTVDDVLGDFF